MSRGAPPGVEIEPVPADRTLSDMLAAGEIDAVYSPRTPRAFLNGNTRRLFAEPRAELFAPETTEGYVI